ncbi:MAG: TonB-dependent receptor [Deltaproteobacteria bacterium]|nr:TonB-dependent receptor [Deltaproteobacteria bacterium]
MVDEVIVTAQRVEQPAVEVPGAVGVVGAQEIRAARKQLTLGESLASIPGVFAQNRNNFAQDLRIAVRGFGARSSFGIRGIKLIVDGIPATLPDGQGQVDSIQLATAERIEVLRGPASSLYGSASGGVIRVVSEEGSAIPFVDGRVAFGSWGLRSFTAKAGGEAGGLNYLLGLSGQEVDGYRDHSRMRNLLFNSKLRYAIGESADLTAVVNVLHSPLAEDPGGLTADEVAVDRRDASPINLQFDAGEAVDQAGGGLVFRKAFGLQHETTFSAFGVWRDFASKVPFRAIGVSRGFAGGSAAHRYESEFLGGRNRLLVGLDVEAQRDHRSQRQNLDGTVGDLIADQDEEVTSIRVFAQDEWLILDTLELTASLGYDRLLYDVVDRFLQDGDDSGSRDFGEWSPMLGLRWSPLDSVNLYARASTAFEPPTTRELANPDGSGGFNPDLEAQRALNLEVGVKGLLPGDLRYELAAFYIQLWNELIRFEPVPGTVYYENAGKSSRIGLELALDWRFHEDWRASLAYTWSLFEFDDYEVAGESFDGKRIPGVPEHLLHAGLSYEHPSGLFGAWEFNWVGSIYADNANRVKTRAYLVSDLRLGYRGRFGAWELSPYVGLDNLFDEEFNDNLRLNADPDFGRYFEPAPEFGVHGGLSIRYHFGGAAEGR